jgi:hypothetical protein
MTTTTTFIRSFEQRSIAKQTIHTEEREIERETERARTRTNTSGGGGRALGAYALFYARSLFIFYSIISIIWHNYGLHRHGRIIWHPAS